jgi:predicted Zn-dependent protease with MMP-like domain
MDEWEITEEYRRYFDKLLEEAIYDLPPDLQRLLEEVFVNAQDQPDERMLRSLQITHPEYLRGSYTGVPATRRGVHDSGRLPETIVLYRLGISWSCRGKGGQIDEDKLRRQIRKTLLHEIGHHFGMDEDDLAAYGYA